jgi:tetratricopeptide (TPR) repeat protein
VHEEATKLSKRAKRRAAGDSSEADTGAVASSEGALEARERVADEAGEAEGGDAAGADAAGRSAPPDAAAGQAVPNRQARRKAASQARARRKREREAASALGLDAAEIVDDALVRLTDKVTRIARRHSNTIQWVLGVTVLAWLGWQVYSWRQASVNAELSDALHAAISAEHGRTGDPSEQGKPNANGVIDPSPIFENDAARLEAAAKRYAEVVELDPQSPAAGFAQIGRGGVLLEQGKLDEALAAFEAAAQAAGDESPELRGGALEGRGVTLETKGDLPGAAAAFEELAKLPSFENRALYQQARIKQLQGDVEASKSLLQKLFEKLGPPKAASFGGLPERPDFLRQRAVQLANLVDPLEKDVKIPKPPMGASAVQQMLDQLKAQGVVPPPAEPSP